jgi:hypothetical protein
MILPALTGATGPLLRPLTDSPFPPRGLATLAAYLDPADDVHLVGGHGERFDPDAHASTGGGRSCGARLEAVVAERGRRRPGTGGARTVDARVPVAPATPG